MEEQNEAKWLAERARALHALSCLMQLVVTARDQTDIATWQKVGGLEAEGFLDAREGVAASATRGVGGTQVRQ